ncbi:MAG: K(+)-insensitive pyrophosphate-energized proton pump [Dehalococcoidia bacterium]|nr:MAG: K(+)-insensitive pyrophosphate-energized proton pump [Dehalococcoidia bacterium]
MEYFWIVPVAGVFAVVFAIYLAWDVLRRDTGTPEMRAISDIIYEGAMAFLRRQYQTIAILAVVGAVIIGIALALIPQPAGLPQGVDLGWRTAVAFLLGAVCSGISGFTGMFVAVKSNIRTAAAARTSLDGAVAASLRGGAVSGFLVVALSLLGVYALFVGYGGLTNWLIAPYLIVGYGFGASFVALFAQLGGGIYTKAADMGADLVGKVEAGVPEDDPRNAAVIADLVGDNVGDCAGRGADLFESTAAESIGAMILGVAVTQLTGNPAWIFFPLIVRALGIFASAAGLMIVRARDNEDPMAALNRGYYLAAALSAIFMVGSTMLILNSWQLAVAGIIGIITSIAFVYITQYYTAGSWRPVQEIANASRTGPATVIVSGTAVGFETTGPTAIAISLALGLAFWLGQQAGLSIPVDPNAKPFYAQSASLIYGIFGTAIATMGMLMTAAYILAMDTFGPITDNAGGIAEMSHQPESTRHITDALDAVGNTTKALTKGYAIASAGLAAFLLFSAYIENVGLFLSSRANSGITTLAQIGIDLAKVEVFIGSLLGAMIVFLFSSLAIRAVGNAAGKIIEEVRRQFRADPGIMAGTSRPDYGRCVDITTRAALREMVAPGILAVAGPVVVGLLLGWQAAGGLLIVGTITGILMATFLNNSGGAWDNAKKFIEAGGLKGADGSIIKKATPEHAAAVVGDTVGDPFKDTAGPSLHVLVKLFSTITLVLLPLFLLFRG